MHYINNNYVINPIYNDENECINDMLSECTRERGEERGAEEKEKKRKDMRAGNFPSCKRERKARGEKGSEGRMKGKHFFHPLARHEVRERGREFSSLSPSFFLSSYACKRACDKGGGKEWELRERCSNNEGNVDVVEEME